MASFFARMAEAYLLFHSPTLIDVYLHRVEHPREMRVCLKVKYERCELRFGAYSPQYTRRLHILSVSGIIRMRKPDSTDWIKILADKIMPTSLDTTRNELSICSKPLSLEEIHDIADRIRDEYYIMTWNLSGYGFVPYDDLYYTLEDLARSLGKGIDQLTPIPAPQVIIQAEGSQSNIDFIKFIKNIVVPAELIDRIFIEIPLAPADDIVIDRIEDPEVRDALMILFEKQNILKEALEEYRKAITTSEYKNVIYKVRGAIEHLTESKSIGNKVFKALAKALEDLKVIREISQGSGARDREINKIKKELDTFSNVLYGLTSTLGVHQSDYEPKPYAHDAEFLLYATLIFINYMIKTLIRYAMRS